VYSLTGKERALVLPELSFPFSFRMEVMQPASDTDMT